MPELIYINCRCISCFPQLQLLITIAFKDGEDTPLYLEKLLKKAIQELETIAADESDE